MDHRWNRTRRRVLARVLVALGMALVAGPQARAIDILGNSATFQWSAAAGPVAGYSVHTSRNGASFAEEVTTSVNELEVTLSGVEGESIAVRVAAFDANGNMGQFSPRSQTVRFVSEQTPSEGAVQLFAQFSEPVFAAGLEGDARLFVVERAGRIQILEGGAVRALPFLNIRDRVGTAGDGGLLGLAFDPDFALNGLFYVLYTDQSGNLVLARFQAMDDPNLATRTSEEILLTIAIPSTTRIGGSLAFNPRDGLLYIALGDCDTPDDPGNLAQDGHSLLGKLLRLDVSDGAGAPYRIPGDNPFTGDPDVLDEIWALGLGNPHIAFDWSTGDLWIVDIGQNEREEIDFEPAGSAGGRNYGWDVMEGSVCNPDDPAPGLGCPNASFTPPRFDYDHSDGNCAIVGGVAYRGPQPQFTGHFFFGDLCSGRIWSLDPSTEELTDRTAELAPAAGTPFELAALTEDGFGALVAIHSSGSVFQLGDTGHECEDGIDNDGDGRSDDADGGCDAASDASELNSEIACDDGFDNDGDGDIDFPNDGGCSSASADFEQTAAEQLEAQADDSEASSECGVGFELVVLLPPLMCLYQSRRRRSCARRG